MPQDKAQIGLQTPLRQLPFGNGSLQMGSTPLGGCIGYFLKFLFSNFRSHIKDSKWGRKYIFMNEKCCSRSPQKIPFQFSNGKLPHSCCRAFWAYTFMTTFSVKLFHATNIQIHMVGICKYKAKVSCISISSSL